MKTAIAFLLVSVVASVANAEQWEEVVQRWPDGEPRMVNVLDGDRQDGTIVKRKMYFESGKLQMEMELKDGLPHGHFVRYYENGKKQMEGDAREGKLKGHQTAWYENGRKKGEGEYQDDVQMPGWKDWDEAGKLIISTHSGE